MLWAQVTQVTGWWVDSLPTNINQLYQHVTVYHITCGYHVNVPKLEGTCLHSRKYQKMVCFNLFKWDKSKACRFTISREVVEPLSNWLWHLGINDVSRAHFVKRWLACQNDFVMGIEPEHLSRAILARNMILSITWLITKIIHVARFLVTQLTIATHTNTWRPRLVLLFDFSLLFSLRDISFRLQAKKNQSSDIPFATWTTWSFRRWKHHLWSSCWNPNFKHCPAAQVTLASAKPSMNAVISWSWLSSPMGKLWQAVSWRDDELQSAKQHQTASGLWLLGEEDLILLLVAILFLSNGAKLQIPIAQWTQKFPHSYYQTWPKHPFGKCIQWDFEAYHPTRSHHQMSADWQSKQPVAGLRPPRPSSLLHLRSPGARVGRWWCWIFDWW